MECGLARHVARKPRTEKPSNCLRFGEREIDFSSPEFHLTLSCSSSKQLGYCVVVVGPQLSIVSGEKQATFDHSSILPCVYTVPPDPEVRALPFPLPLLQQVLSTG